MVVKNESFSVEDSLEGFSIGDASLITDMPVETIRFLETIGLITPSRKKSSAHRRYSDDDLARLMDYRIFRLLGIPSQTAVNLITAGSLLEHIDVMNTVLPEAREAVMVHERIAWHLEDYRNTLEMLKLSSPGTIEIATRPEYYYCAHAHFQDQIAKYRKAQSYVVSQSDNFRIMLFSEALFCLFKESFSETTFDVGVSFWLAFQSDWMRLLDPVLHLDMARLPSTPALRSILLLPKDSNILSAIKSTFFPYMEEHNLVLSDDVWGRAIVNVHENDVDSTYYEVWAPVTNA